MDSSTAAVMDRLYELCVRNLPPGALAEIFDRLIWCLEDNGAALAQNVEIWLTSGDKGKVAVALAMDEQFPFSDPSEMESVLAKISSRWPDFAERCADLRDRRRTLTE